MMHKSFLVVVGGLFLVSLTSVKADTPKLTLKQLAANAFVELQKAETDKELSAQIKELVKTGHQAKYAKTDSVVLSAQCGFAGCDHLLLVTTPYETQGSNTGTKTVAALVSANDYIQTKSVKRVLTSKQLKELSGE